MRSKEPPPFPIAFCLLRALRIFSTRLSRLHTPAFMNPCVALLEQSPPVFSGARIALFTHSLKFLGDLHWKHAKCLSAEKRFFFPPPPPEMGGPPTFPLGGPGQVSRGIKEFFPPTSSLRRHYAGKIRFESPRTRWVFLLFFGSNPISFSSSLYPFLSKHRIVLRIHCATCLFFRPLRTLIKRYRLFFKVPLVKPGLDDDSSTCPSLRATVAIPNLPPNLEFFSDGVMAFFVVMFFPPLHCKSPLLSPFFFFLTSGDGLVQ